MSVSVTSTDSASLESPYETSWDGEAYLIKSIGCKLTGQQEEERTDSGTPTAHPAALEKGQTTLKAAPA